MKQDLIRQIKELKKIEPSQEWLNSTRGQLVAQIDFQERADFKAGIGFFQWLRQPQSAALVICLLLIFIGGPWLMVKASQTSLPGDLLYSVKKITEDVQTSIASEDDKVQLQVEFAGRRLEELNKITEDSFSPEEKTEKVKEVVDDLKNNLAGASVYANKVPKEKAIVIAKKAKKIKEDLDKTREEAPLEVQAKLAEAEKAVEEINKQILSALVRESQEGDGGTSTSTDEEILIFLEETEEGTITTTDKIINGVEE
jgi:hypothetical protein